MDRSSSSTPVAPRDRHRPSPSRLQRIVDAYQPGGDLSDERLWLEAERFLRSPELGAMPFAAYLVERGLGSFRTEPEAQPELRSSHRR